MSGIRVGLIGYGGWTRLAFVPALRQHDGVRIVSAAAFSRDSQDRIREELGPDVQVYGGFEALLDGPEVDAVMMAIPDSIHEAAMNAVLDAGVAAYYEPPLAGSPDGIRKMLRRLVEADQVTHSDLEIGFATVVHRAADLVRQGVIGALQAVHLKLRSDWAGFGGPDLCLVHHLGPWYVDGLNSILGRSPERVLVMDGHGQAGRRQFHSLAHFDYGELWGTLHLNINSVDKLETTIEVTGDEGDLTVDYFRNTIHLRRQSHSESEVIRVEPAMPVVGGWPGEAESVAEFLNAVEKGTPNRTDGQMAAQLYLTGLAIERSRDSGGWVEIEDAAGLEL
ncbi:MAG: Gfo/Idh/MocA family oxidoreductase [Gemmatimonadetes bacterium]|nr:Gfo/Idh/MocA family oxidoreductase [Gemmatimonadota bacterium]